MRKYTLFFLGTLFLVNHIYCQTNFYLKNDTLNYNEKGKKHGYWLEFLNERLVPTNKKKKATYYGVCYYENGTRIYPNYGSNATIRYRVISNENKESKGHPVMLNGYYYKIQKGDTIESLLFKDGNIQLIKSYYNNKNMRYYFDYSNKIKGDNLSHYFIEYGLDGEIKTKGSFNWVDSRWKFVNNEMEE